MKNGSYPLYKTTLVNNLRELINYIGENYTNDTAFTYERKKTIVNVSFGKLKSDIEALSTALFDLGVKNKSVAVIGENSYEWIITYFAVVNSGNVIVPLDKELPKADINNLLIHSNAEVFVFSQDFSDVAEYSQENGATIRHYINMKDLMGLVERGNILIEKGEKEALNYKVDNHAMTAVLYTSGTTGIAKGVMLSHYNIARNTVGSGQYIDGPINCLLVLPLHHSFAFTANICATLLRGRQIIINSSLKKVLEDLQKFQPYNMFLVPLFVEVFYKKIWDTANKQGKTRLLKSLIFISDTLLKIGIDLRGVLFKSVRQSFGGNLGLLLCGGAFLDTKYITGLRSFGIEVRSGYGITECSPVVSVNRNYHYRDGSIGRIVEFCEVKIENQGSDGHGEIYVKGDNVMLGYYKDEKSTKDAFDGEWFKTGDIGYIDKDGYLFIVGREKNLIVLSNGKNVYPEELEQELLNIPYINEVIVSAEGDKIVAEVFLDTENEPDCASKLDNDILNYNRNAAGFKNISKIVVRDTEFPKTTTKKIKRFTGRDNNGKN